MKLFDFRRAVAWTAVALFTTAPGASAQDGLRAKTEAWVAANQRTIVAEFLDLLAIPNVAADRPNIERNAVHGSDGADTAAFEIGYFFRGMEL